MHGAKFPAQEAVRTDLHEVTSCTACPVSRTPMVGSPLQWRARDHNNHNTTAAPVHGQELVVGVYDEHNWCPQSRCVRPGAIMMAWDERAFGLPAAKGRWSQVDVC